MSHIHVDRPGEISWWPNRGPATVLGPCPHTCPHHTQQVIAWGPDTQRYELIRCDTPEGCDGLCRAWTDGGQGATTAWLHVDHRDGVVP